MTLPFRLLLQFHMTQLLQSFQFPPVYIFLQSNLWLLLVVPSSGILSVRASSSIAVLPTVFNMRLLSICKCFAAGCLVRPGTDRWRTAGGRQICAPHQRCHWPSAFKARHCSPLLRQSPLTWSWGLLRRISGTVTTRMTRTIAREQSSRKKI